MPATAMPGSPCGRVTHKGFCFQVLFGGEATRGGPPAPSARRFDNSVPNASNGRSPSDAALVKRESSRAKSSRSGDGLRTILAALEPSSSGCGLNHLLHQERSNIGASLQLRSEGDVVSSLNENSSHVCPADSAAALFRHGRGQTYGEPLEFRQESVAPDLLPVTKARSTFFRRDNARRS
jgi:hypothetical protein